MAHVALYREWRPLTFDEVVEQVHVVTALRQAVMTGQIAHAYLFSGTRGTGKTTVAKVFSRAINCLDPHEGNPCNQCEICTGILNGSLLDVVEMDAASNNSVDTIRRIVDEVVFMPSQARYKVYIIDEVHMLSTGAFNALLKTLEEPPAHAVFILATTEPYRIPATILSRCQRYEFRRIPLPGLIGRLREIAAADGIAIEAEALDTIARLAEGGMRDAISLLDQVRMAGAPEHPVNRDDVLRLTGVADDDLMAQASRALLTGDAPELLDAVSQLVMTGRDPARFLLDLAAYCRNLLVVAVTPDPAALVQVTRDQLQRLREIARLSSGPTLVALVRELSALHGELRWSSDSRTALEIGLLRLMSEQSAPCASPAAAVPPAVSVSTSAETAVPTVSAAPTTPAAPSKEQPAPVKPSEQPAPAKALESSAPAIVLASVAADMPLLNPEADMLSDDLTGLEAPPLPEPPPVEPMFIPPAVPRPAEAVFVPQMTPAPAETVPVPQPVPPAAEPAQAIAAEAGKGGDLFSQPAAASADPGDQARWQSIQDQLIQDGQMTLYLFSRPAAFSFCGGELHLLFSEKDKVNYQELKEPQNLKSLRSAAARVIGTDTPVVVRQASDPEREARHCPVPQEPAWITRVREAADAFGIPIKMEEN